MSCLNVLVLHRMGDPRSRREAVRALEYMLPESRPDINCIVHDADIPFPAYLKDLEYHLIVLGPTFLCYRHDRRSLDITYRKWGFIRESAACKVALPQDDYETSAALDEWMTNWRIDRVYSVIPDHWEVLYPQYSQTGDIALGYTGYVSDSWIDSWKHPKEHAARKIDVSYRTLHSVAINRCYFRHLKYAIAARFKAAVMAAGADIVLDISTSSKDFISGVQWHQFMEDSKFCLTSPSGSSVLDPRGELRQRVTEFCLRNPDADFDYVAEHLLRGKDRIYNFTAISPRNIEAALAETVQIGTPGTYSGLLRPGEHFIPLDEDCANIGDVLTMMGDSKLVADIKRQCKEVMLSEPRLRRSVIVNEILEFAESVISARKIVGSDQMKVKKEIERYEEEIGSISRRYWSRRRMVSGVAEVATKLGARRVQRFLFPVK